MFLNVVYRDLTSCPYFI